MAQSGTGRLEEFLGQVPVVTRALLFVNLAVHALIFIFSLSLNTFAISAHLVVNDAEYYRVVSAAFVHAGLMHIFMNMSSLLQLGLSLEAHFGSLQFLFLTLWSIFAVGIVYVCLAVLFSYVDPAEMYSSGVGYSGILFTYALIESFHTTETSRSIFGMFSVPSRMYPFILLIILQIVIPNISFLGHGAGILVGLAVVYGGMNFILPSNEFLLYLEGTAIFAPLSKSSGFVRANSRSMVHTTSSGSGGGGCSSAGKMVFDFFGCIWNVIAAALFIIGCPVERMANSVSAFCQSIGQTVRRFFEPTPSETERSTELGRYARVESAPADVETPATGVSTATGAI